MSKEMKFIKISGSRVTLHNIELDFEQNDFFYVEGHRFSFLTNVPLGFELGFYNIIYDSDSIVGVNLALEDEKVERRMVELSKVSDAVVIEGSRVNVLLKPLSEDSWIDYAESFVDFYFFESKDDVMGFSFKIP